MWENILIFLAGIFTWTLTEYWLHRYMGHTRKRGLFYKEHSKHHFVNDYFAPAIYKLRAALVTSVICFGLVSFILSISHSMIFTISFVGMYLLYERVHFLLHIKGPQSRYLAIMARHHFSHHYHNEKMNHGVTSTIWDHVFRTYYSPESVILVPTKYKMKWMAKGITWDQWGQAYAER